MKTIYGFRNDGVAEDHYQFAGYSGIEDRPVINPSGNWEPYLPEPETQSSRFAFFDSRNCVVYGTNNALETLAKFHGLDFPHDCSDRYGGVMCGTGPDGNDPHKVIEITRTSAGVIPEAALPFTEHVRSREEYFAPDPMAYEFIRLGEESIRKFEIRHEWVFNDRSLSQTAADKQPLLQMALTRGTVAVSVRAWEKRGDLYKKNRKAKDNHWCQLVSCVPGKSWRIFDSYDQHLKDLEWDYNFECAKVYYLAPRLTPEKRSYLLSLLDQAAKALKDLLTLVRAREHRVDLPSVHETPVERLPDPVPALSWEDPKGAFKLTRIMCDELGLTVAQKNIVCAAIYQESRFRNRKADGSPIINENKKNGTVWSTDYGIVQVNDYWHIGPGKTFPSLAYVMDNPEKMVRWMVQTMKDTGRLQPWSSYVSGAYKQWLPTTSAMWKLKS